MRIPAKPDSALIDGLNGPSSAVRIKFATLGVLISWIAHALAGEVESVRRVHEAIEDPRSPAPPRKGAHLLPRPNRALCGMTAGCYQKGGLVSSFTNTGNSVSVKSRPRNHIFQ